MEERNKNSIVTFILFFIIACSVSTCALHISKGLWIWTQPDHIKKCIDLTSVREGDNFTLNLESMFGVAIDSIFVFISGPIPSSDISELIGVPYRQGLFSSIQDTQACMILFSHGKIIHEESFDISYYDFDRSDGYHPLYPSSLIVQSHASSSPNIPKWFEIRFL